MRYKNLIILVTASMFLASCTKSSVETTQTAKADDCPAIKGVGEVLDNPLPRVIVLGELHGMDGPPSFAQALVCHSLARGKKTALGFEMSDDADGTINTYLLSNGDEAAKEALFKLGMWTNSFTDGRSSEAMLDLLNFARLQAKQRNENFKSFLFQETDADWTKYESNPKTVLQANELGMATNILKEANASGVDKTIVLVGNLHAKRAKNAFGSNDYDYMANHMLNPETVTLSNVYTSGKAWNCMGSPSGETVCGESETQGNVDAASELAKTEGYAVVISETPPSGYDGVFYVGSAKASPPANMDGRVADK